jgi:hypothetical protein
MEVNVWFLVVFVLTWLAAPVTQVLFLVFGLYGLFYLWGLAQA